MAGSHHSDESGNSDVMIKVPPASLSSAGSGKEGGEGGRGVAVVRWGKKNQLQGEAEKKMEEEEENEQQQKQ